MKTTIVLMFLFSVCILGYGQTAKQYFDRGVKKYNIEDFQGAIRDFNNAIKLDPKHAKAYYKRGQGKFELKDLNGTIQDINKAVEISPQEIDFYNFRAFTYLSLNDIKKACFDWKKAGELGDKTAYDKIKEHVGIKMGSTTDEVKEYFSLFKNELDPLEGIWLRHLKTKHYYKGKEVPDWSYDDAQIVIVKQGEIYSCYHLELYIWNKVDNLLISNSVSDYIYMYKFTGEKFFGFYSVDKSFKLTNNQFETNFEREGQPPGVDVPLIEIYSALYEKLFPQ